MTITTQPAALSVTAGQAATFTVVASGTPAPTYQWQRNGVDIPGAQSDAYALPATVMADSGAVFRVQITSLAGNVVSEAVTLAVTPSGPRASVSPGLIAYYFDDLFFAGKHLRRIDAVVNGERQRKFWIDRDQWLPFIDVLKMNLDLSYNIKPKWKK